MIIVATPPENNPRNQINLREINDNNVCQCVDTIDQLHNVDLTTQRLQSKKWKDMNMLLQNIKSHMSHKNWKNISHNVIQSYPICTKCLLEFMGDKVMGVLPTSLWHMWPILFCFFTNYLVVWLLKHLDMLIEKLTPSWNGVE
jgi:hypothetical protein